MDAPWERLEGESGQAWAAFCVYRDMGIQRSISKVAAQFDRNPDNVGKWSREYRWVTRVQAWEAEQDRVRREAALVEVAAASRRSVLAGQLLMGKGIKRIREMSDEEVALLSPWEAIRLIESGARLERIGRGEPPEPVAAPQQVDVSVTVSPDVRLIEFMRSNPSRVGGIVEALAALREASTPAVLIEGTAIEVTDGDPSGDEQDEEVRDDEDQ